MYHAIVRKRIAGVFAHLDQDYEYALSGIGTTIEHQFAGNHCLGGRRPAPELCDSGSNVSFDCSQTYNSRSTQYRYRAFLGIPLRLRSGRTEPLLLMGAIM